MIIFPSAALRTAFLIMHINLEELTKTIAERNGTTPEAVRREMEAPRNSAWDTDDSSARGRQKVLFPAGKPQLSEFLEIIAKEIKKA